MAIQELVAIFEEARRSGLLGPQPVTEQMAHSRALTAQLPPAAARIADLGSGAGLPGLVVAAERPSAHLTLVEVAERRADHLRRAVRRLGWTDRVEVAAEPAERVGRRASHRGAFDAVVARSCAPPPVVAELAVPLLREAGALVVAEPPGTDGARWASLVESPLPLLLDEVIVTEAGTFARLVATGACPDRFPRSPGVSARRPLF